jgi:fluoride ion exporter CrcB/FEX
MFRRRRRSWIAIVWLVVGLVVAVTHGFLGGLTTLSGFVAAILAVLLWPLVLLNLHITF